MTSNSFPFLNPSQPDVIVAVTVYQLLLRPEKIRQCENLDELNELVDATICDSAARLSIALPAMGDQLGDVYESVASVVEESIRNDNDHTYSPELLDSIGGES